MDEDRERCLREFEAYYRSHSGALASSAQAEGDGGTDPSAESIFEPSALLRLYDDYCRDSAARLYDNVRRLLPLMPEGSRQSATLRILDITCFATTQMFRILFPRAAVHACDKHLRWCAFLEGVECRSCNLEKDDLPYEDDHFDVVVFTETLEHIPRSPYAILGEVRRVLKRGGLLVFSVPNLNSLTNRIKMLLGRDVLSVERFYLDAFGHFREYTMNEVRHLLARSAMDLVVGEHIFYHGALHARGNGLHAMRTRAIGLVSRPLMRFVPAFRPVCLAIARKT